MTDEQMREHLKTNGWHAWYNDNYWVSTKTIKDKSRQDYTEYGMNLQDAYAYDTDPKREAFNGQFLHGALRW